MTKKEMKAKKKAFEKYAVATTPILKIYNDAVIRARILCDIAIERAKANYNESMGKIWKELESKNKEEK